METQNEKVAKLEAKLEELMARGNDKHKRLSRKKTTETPKANEIILMVLMSLGLYVISAIIPMAYAVIALIAIYMTAIQTRFVGWNRGMLIVGSVFLAPFALAVLIATLPSKKKRA